MSDWPEDFAIQNCIEWNEAAERKALADANNPSIRVPPSAKKRVYRDGRPLWVQLTADEYRVERMDDADRHAANIDKLRRRLAA